MSYEISSRGDAIICEKMKQKSGHFLLDVARSQSHIISECVMEAISQGKNYKKSLINFILQLIIVNISTIV